MLVKRDLLYNFNHKNRNSDSYKSIAKILTILISVINSIGTT